MLSIANFCQTIGFYGFANWVPTLLIAKGIHVSQTLEYSFIIAFAYPLFPLISQFLVRRSYRTQMASLPLVHRHRRIRHRVLIADRRAAVDHHWHVADDDERLALVLGAQLSVGTVPYPDQGHSAVGFVYSWSRFSTIFTGFFIAAILQHFGVPGRVPVRRQRHGRRRAVDRGLRPAHQPPFAGGDISARHTTRRPSGGSPRLTAAACQAAIAARMQTGGYQLSDFNR